MDFHIPFERSPSVTFSYILSKLYSFSVILWVRVTDRFRFRVRFRFKVRVSVKRPL